MSRSDTAASPEAPGAPSPLALAFRASQADPPDLAALAAALGPLSPSPLFDIPEAHALIPSAILKGSAAALRLVLAAGADPNAPHASACVSLCVVSDRAELCEILLRHGADPAEPGFGQAVSALNSACSKSTPRSLLSLKALLAHGADPNAPDAAGFLPLSRCSSPERARLLIDAGADPLATTPQGLALAERARQMGKPELADFLASAAEARALGAALPAPPSRPKPGL